MLLLQRQNGSQRRRKNVSDEKNKCQEQGPFRLEQVPSHPRQSHFPYGNWVGVQGWRVFLKCATMGPEPQTPASLQKGELEGNPGTYGMLRANFSTCLIE